MILSRDLQDGREVYSLTLTSLYYLPLVEAVEPLTTLPVLLKP